MNTTCLSCIRHGELCGFHKYVDTLPTEAERLQVLYRDARRDLANLIRELERQKRINVNQRRELEAMRTKLRRYAAALRASLAKCPPEVRKGLHWLFGDRGLQGVKDADWHLEPGEEKP